HPILVNTVQNTAFKGGPITRFAKLKLQVLDKKGGVHTRSAKFYIAEIRKEDVILGTNWLLEHNLEVDWHAYGLYFTRCLPSCNITGGLIKAKRAFRKPGCQEPEMRRMIHCTETSAANTPAHKVEPTKAAIGKQTKHTNLQKLAEEASKGKPELPFEEIIPRPNQLNNWKYRKVFKGQKPGKLPPKQPWDHKIELKDNMEHSLRPKLYSLSPMEQEELKKFIDESLKKGFI
ncbi:hypothetical protein HETIRDRAFT_49390, partial [Heterobasidion irregulare TC 32-1]